MTFVPVSGAAQYRLGDVKVENMNCDDDTIQVLDPETLDAPYQYTYVTSEMAQAIYQNLIDDGEDPEDAKVVLEWVGWWDAAIGVGEDDARADDVMIDNGNAFLGLFGSRENVKFICSGEAPTKPTQWESKELYKPFLCNYLPKTIKLGQIVVENMNCDDDTIQVLDPETLDAPYQYTYVTTEMAEAIYQNLIDDGEDPEDAKVVLGWVGWWDAAIGVGEDDARVDERDVLPNEGFLGLFGSRENLVFRFPSVLDTYEVPEE